MWDTSGTPIDVQPFCHPVGPAQAISPDPAELFRLFFTDDIVHNIVAETNRYAAQCLEGKQTTWTTSAEEIWAYFGFYIFMGLGERARDKRLLVE